MEETTNAAFGTGSGYPQPDPAAILGAACSLKRVWIDDVDLETRLRLAQRLPGVDSVMREILRIATRFETWACRNVDFEALDEVWPYFLEAEFGEACKVLMKHQDPTSFGEAQCRAVAEFLELTLR